jgi:hypothetical protein
VAAVRVGAARLLPGHLWEALRLEGVLWAQSQEGLWAPGLLRRERLEAAALHAEVHPGAGLSEEAPRADLWADRREAPLVGQRREAPLAGQRRAVLVVVL